MDPPYSNERWCTKLEIVLSRLDSIGVELEKQKRITQHNDSFRPLGVAFSGISLCGVEIGLRVYTEFDADGVFADDAMCVFIGTQHMLTGHVTRANEGYEWITKPLHHKHPSLLACGPEGILARREDIKEAHRLVSLIALDLGTRTGDLEIHGINQSFVDIAIPYVEMDRDCAQAIWIRMDVAYWDRIFKDHSFFTPERVMYHKAMK